MGGPCDQGWAVCLVMGFIAPVFLSFIWLAVLRYFTAGYGPLCTLDPRSLSHTLHPTKRAPVLLSFIWLAVLRYFTVWGPLNPDTSLFMLVVW